MPDKPAKQRWTRTEKWLIAAPLLVLLCLFGMTTGRNILFKQLLLPRLVLQYDGIVRDVVMSGDGRVVATGGRSMDVNGKLKRSSGEVRVWNGQTGELLHRFPPKKFVFKSGPNKGYTSGFDLTALALSRDGKLLASAGLAEKTQLRETTSGRLLGTFPFAASGLAFSPDGKLLANSDLEIWNVRTMRLLRRLAPRGYSRNLEFSPDSHLLATCTASPRNKQGEPSGGQVELWNAATGALLRKLPSLLSESFSFAPDGKRLISAERVVEPNSSGTGTSGFRLRMFEVDTGKQLWQREFPGIRFNDVVFAPDGMVIACHQLGHLVTLRNAKSGELILTLRGNEDSVSQVVVPPALAISTDGKTLLGRGKNSLKIWDLPRLEK